jgi:hypothetical protein
VELAPKTLVPGVLYVSEKYRVAIHLCCCGCGEKVVTPLSPAEWQLQLHGGIATLQPSVGNGTTCRSHYWIRRSRVEWVPRMTSEQIAYARRRDRASLDAMYASRRDTRKQRSLQQQIGSAIRAAWKWLQGRQ